MYAKSILANILKTYVVLQLLPILDGQKNIDRTLMKEEC